MASLRTWGIGLVVFLIIGSVVTECGPGYKSDPNYKLLSDAASDQFGLAVKQVYGRVGLSTIGAMNTGMDDALIEAQSVLEDRLNHPKTMKDESSQFLVVAEFTDGTFYVSSKAEAQNSFGVADDVRYKVRLGKSGKEWTLIGFATGDEDLGILPKADDSQTGKGSVADLLQGRLDGRK